MIRDVNRIDMRGWISVLGMLTGLHEEIDMSRIDMKR